MKYKLINSTGCLFEEIEETSYRKARKYFADYYIGKFIILFDGYRRNVRL